MQAVIDRKLGLIAGSGSLPGLVGASAVRTGWPVFMVGFKGHTAPETLASYNHMWARLGGAGTTLRRLRAEGVTHLVMAGAIRRPSPAELRPDWYTAQFFARVGLRALGDDGFLRVLAAQLEREGFTLLGSRDFLIDCMAGEGPIGAVHPDAIHSSDIVRGIEVARMLGRLDVGQAAVVQQGIVLGVEGAEGTDQLIARTARLARGGSRPVLVKLAKPQQDARLDLPTVGPQTIASLSANDFAGIAVEAGATQMLDLSIIVEAADKAKIFVSGVTADTSI